MADPAFGKRLSALRVAANLTRYRLAKMSGVSAIQLTRIEEQGQAVYWLTACKLADAMGVSVAEFREESKR